MIEVDAYMDVNSGTPLRTTQLEVEKSPSEDRYTAGQLQILLKMS